MRCSDKFKPVVDIHGVYFAAQFPENRKPRGLYAGANEKGGGIYAGNHYKYGFPPGEYRK